MDIMKREAQRAGLFCKFWNCIENIHRKRGKQRHIARRVARRRLKRMLARELD